MKKISKLSFIVLLTIISCLIFVACTRENDNEQGVETKNLLKTNNFSRLATTACDIVGPLVINNGTYTYNYTNNTNNTEITWTATPTSAATIISGQGTSTISIVFYSNCTLSAYGKKGNDDCQKTITITKSSTAANGNLCYCFPLFANHFYDVPVNVGGAYVKNSIFFEDRGCGFNWSTVSSVKIQIGGSYGVGSNSTSVPNINTMGQGGGMSNNINWTTTPSGFRNIKIRTHLNASNITPGFLMNNTLGPYGGWATIKFNNGCPDKLLYLNDDMELSPI